MLACKICIAQKGLKGSEVFSGKCNYVFQTKEELFAHLEKEHNFKIIDKAGGLNEN